jgi:hypothetical protein
VNFSRMLSRAAIGASATTRHGLLLGATLALAACAAAREGAPARPAPVEALRALVEGVGERAGLVLEKDAYGDGATKLVYLDQGWGPLETLWFYHADQGSVLMPYDVLVHLEQADRAEPFVLPEHMTRFRFLAQHRTPNNPDALPVGFSRHGDQVGLTCAACHTTQINYRGTAIRVDGAPALIDASGFFHAVEAALRATLADQAKFGRFAAATGAGAEAARRTLTESLAWFESYNTANRSSTAEGFGRMDAIGRIINQVIRFTSDPKNSLEPNAPASMPFLWDAPRHDYVQWTGFAPNAGAGSLGRNTGEVVGVFGRVEVQHYDTAEDAKHGYKSTIASPDLVAMEETLRKLESPLWPENVLPPIDRALAARGEALYRTQCVSCHAILDRADPRRHVVAMVTGVDVVGTDATEAKNLSTAHAPTGVLAGAVTATGGKYGADASAIVLLGDVVTGAVSAHPAAAVGAALNAKVNGLETTPKQGDHPQNTEKNPNADLMSYKARPLNGIWATSPYLHNGSVPTLFDLLLPAAARPARFSVGRWEYDPKKVGHVDDGSAPFVVDTGVPGNSNRGHEYGTSLPDADRWALVEYLKTL